MRGSSASRAASPIKLTLRIAIDSSNPGQKISDIVRLTTIVDIHAALVEKRAYRLPFTHAKAFEIMEQMGGKLDQHLLQAFRPVALGSC